MHPSKIRLDLLRQQDEFDDIHILIGDNLILHFDIRVFGLKLIKRLLQQLLLFGAGTPSGQRDFYRFFRSFGFGEALVETRLLKDAGELALLALLIVSLVSATSRYDQNKCEY